MRIAFVITRADDIGGAQVHVRDLAEALLARGEQVAVFAGGQGAFAEQLRERGVPFTSIPDLARPVRPARDLRALAQLRRALADFRPDLVTTHSSKAGVVGRLAARSLGVPCVYTAHGWQFAPGTSRRRQVASRNVERWLTRLTERVITVSDEDRDLALWGHVVPRRDVVTIHNGMPDVPEALRADPSRQPPRLLTVARMVPQKDHATLLHALAAVADLPWEADLVGDGPGRPAVEALIRELGLEGRVHLLGYRSDIPELVARSQVFALASNWEGFPLTILEAMRARLPVVASDVGGVREAVVDGETGAVVPRGDVARFAAALRPLLADPALRARMGDAGRARYEARFTFAQMIERTHAVYRDVVG